ncbi:2-oxoglutarate dehydrogenase complex dihydrolipoyllysine-residue succinyltransferase [Rickettsiales endosymbiont of Stachyamoeba lipophora]|uniref:2-oxoglutarate dehydrogenase complex dihydrolipoyllysine-residue succinyltransferase n=1 Tax=Rickettsiales endosymbiont of Stachyamoeba lipophora TaxID=2486578 RepID=UPI000F654B62|nr:2-oxoglutarate dehydrogenase complex dihydrolipoyllysine-residue succinyltransferase [Rickettsiales endosymbiont of Stachyamoeba lipophora]AZL15613.1 2-oxoglutarate dehydrogenase complex dihydrolipoyllysine-residue succinyltransferase [Rickettsiales endosymbiont of Stachyamoeba lipophora]
MSVEIKVPSLGESVTEATVGKWLVKEGDAVKQDQNLVELETDKVTMEVTSPAAGLIEKISIQAGATVEIGAILGLLKAGDFKATANEQNKVESPEPKAQEKSQESKILSPAAQKLAIENNIASQNISGTGRDGRVTKGDILDAVNKPSTIMSPAVSADKPVEIVPMTRLRKKIAERLKESQSTAAMLTTFNEVDMFEVMELRKKHKDAFEKKFGVKMGFMSFFVKAAVAALKELPAVNAEISGENIIYKNYYDIGVAVGTEQGLVVPVVKNADKLSFAGIESEIMNLAKKARDGKLSMSDLSGGTFSITNGGIYGSLMSTPIINPPQAGILGMHKIEERPKALKGQVVIRPMMYIALTYDHRLIDGKEAVTFLVKIKESIENPEKLLLDL